MFHVKHWKGDKDMAIDYNRQYVGARYVPQFFNNPDGSWDWAQGFQYEPLTMVKYGTNTYTSKQLVPATVGTPNANPEYWAQTGNYNGQISDLYEKYKELGKKMYQRNILIIGDSYAEGGIPESGTPWAELVKQRTAYIGWNVEIQAKGGAGMVSSTQGKNFLDLLNQATSPYVDTIIVQGFINDCVNGVLNSNFAQAITTFTAQVNNKYPGANLIFMPLSKNVTQNNFTAITEAATYAYNLGYNVWWPAWYIICAPQCVLNDNVHPTLITNNNTAWEVIGALTNGAWINVRVETTNYVVEMGTDKMEIFIKNISNIGTNVTNGDAFNTDMFTCLNPYILNNEWIKTWVFVDTEGNMGEFLLGRINGVIKAQIRIPAKELHAQINLENVQIYNYSSFSIPPFNVLG